MKLTFVEKLKLVNKLLAMCPVDMSDEEIDLLFELVKDVKIQKILNP